jgi:hypothetical protein
MYQLQAPVALFRERTFGPPSIVVCMVFYSCELRQENMQREYMYGSDKEDRRADMLRVLWIQFMYFVLKKQYKPAPEIS